jgi:hypothetical protein
MQIILSVGSFILRPPYLSKPATERFNLIEAGNLKTNYNTS